MEKEIKNQKEETTKKKVENKKITKGKTGKKIGKVILAIIVIAIVALAIHTIRNYVIITNLQKRISNYNNSTNYYTKSIATENNGTIVTMEYYKKGNKQVVFLERKLNGETTKVSMYNNGQRTDTFTETKNSKTVKLNSQNEISINIYNYLETENNWQTFLGSISSIIRSEKCNSRDCYSIKGFMSSSSLTYDNQTVYIEKDTGLYTKLNTNEVTTERKYQFDNVQDSIFVEPDIGQYKLENEIDSTTNGESNSTNNNENQNNNQNGTSTSVSSNEPSSYKDTLLKVMKNESKLIDENNKEVLFKNFEIPGETTTTAEKYTFVDLDKDGNEELVIYTTADYGAYVILNYENGKVYGYLIGVRSLENLKTDGSFIGSNGANSNEYCNISFDKNTYKIETIAINDGTNNMYKINDKTVSKEKIEEYVNSWNKKEDVKWIKV